MVLVSNFRKVDNVLGAGVLLILLSPWVIPSEYIFPYQFKVIFYAFIFSSVLLIKNWSLNAQWHLHITKTDIILIFYLLYLILRAKLGGTNQETFLKILSLSILHLYFRQHNFKQLWLFISVLPIIGLIQAHAQKSVDENITPV